MNCEREEFSSEYKHNNRLPNGRGSEPETQPGASANGSLKQGSVETGFDVLFYQSRYFRCAVSQMLHQGFLGAIEKAIHQILNRKPTQDFAP